MYVVMFMTEKGTERIECVSESHANEVYNAISAPRKNINIEQNGKIKRIK